MGQGFIRPFSTSWDDGEELEGEKKEGEKRLEAAAEGQKEEEEPALQPVKAAAGKKKRVGDGLEAPAQDQAPAHKKVRAAPAPAPAPAKAPAPQKATSAAGKKKAGVTKKTEEKVKKVKRKK